MSRDALEPPTEDRRPAVIVPSLGKSPWFVDCLAALARDGGAEVARVLVWQGPAPPAAADVGVDRVLVLERPAGFAAAVNRGIAATGGWAVGVVNDDAVVAPGFCRTLLDALAAAPAVAAVQGVNLRPDGRVDGCGIGWNRWLQAIQCERDLAPPGLEAAPRAVFGVSATAAWYRRRALATIAPKGAAFEPRLGSYYEDVLLAGRLRAGGWEARCLPAVRATHLGSATGAADRAAYSRLLHRNRLWVLLALLGGRALRRLPWLLARDLADLAAELRRGDWATARGVLSGVAAALARLAAPLAWSGPRLAPAELSRWCEAAPR